MGGSCRSAVIFTKTSWGDRFMYQSVGWPREWYLVEAVGFDSYIRDIVAKMLNPMGLLPPPPRWSKCMMSHSSLTLVAVYDTTVLSCC